jgi:glycosyltransferase involved in cell wall biosynthesis
VLTVGRTLPVKGHQLLVDAIGKLRRDGVDVRLTIVGDGPLLEDLRGRARSAGVEDRVLFAGAVGQDRVREFYERADVFALPSFAEGLPVVLVEAMAMGLPVVASRITGIPELVQEGVSGFLFVPGRVDELADALARMESASGDERVAMGRAGRQRVEQEFDVEVTVASLRQIFTEFLGKGTGARPRD